jgi:hypothetical protein
MDQQHSAEKKSEKNDQASKAGTKERTKSKLAPVAT